MTGSLDIYVSRLPDPRRDRGRWHLLSDLMLIAIPAVIGGAEHWTEIEEFGHAKEEWLRTFLKLPRGIPSHDRIYGREIVIRNVPVARPES